jgi:Family of unknown function (DUF6049)
MSRSRIARARPSPAPAGQPGRGRRALAATAVCVLATPAVWIALAFPERANAAGTRQGATVPVALAITSVSPAIASPGKTVTVRGSVTNQSAAAISGLAVQLRSSSISLSTRDALQQYAAGFDPLADTYVPGAVWRLRGDLARHATASWSIRLRAAVVGMTHFGVYPLAAEADGASGAALPGGTSRTFLPYWPRKHGRYRRPVRQQIAWILPIIDQPRQGVCPGLENNSLAASLAPGGRLASLLAAGTAEAASTHLTWAIDPSLLASAQVMSHPYRVGGNDECRGYRQLPASRAAARWLAEVKSATRGQSVFVTPYADVDIAALTRESLDKDLASAFAAGRSIAGRILGRNFSPAPQAQHGQAAAQQLTGLAWPTDGLANRAVLENLAVNKISTVVLDSATMPPVHAVGQGFVPATAVTSTPDGVNGDMRVLLADGTLTQVLGSANSPYAPPGTVFAVEQRFLAETALLAAQGPRTARSIVVAPPRRWNPPAGLVTGLLAQTASAPWLKPVSLGSLATAKIAARQVRDRPPASSGRGELSGQLLGQVRVLDRRVALLQSIREQPDPALGLAIAGVESSAWRGGRAAGRQAQALLDKISGYVTSQQRALTIVSPKPVTLGGLRGNVPVSISSRLPYTVRVRLGVSVPGDGSISSSLPGIVQIQAGSVVDVKLKVHAAAVGSTTISLRLLTPEGKQLPDPPVTMTIQATHFGTLALVILAAALGIFMITSAARAIRQGRAVPQPDPPGVEPGAATGTDEAAATEDSAKTEGTGGTAGTEGADGIGGTALSGASNGIIGATGARANRSGGSEWRRNASETGSVVRDHADQRAADLTEDTDEFARAPGWADRD